MLEKQTVHQIEVFKDLTSQQIDELYTWIEQRRYDPGAEIIKEGNQPNGLYLLTGGSVAVLKHNTAGKIKLTEIAAPSFFGEVGLLIGGARSAGIRAESKVVVGYIPKVLFDQKLAANNITALRISLNIGRILCHRLTNTSDMLANTALLAAHQARTTGIHPPEPPH